MIDWRGFRFYRLTQVPKPEQDRADRRRSASTGPLAAALAGAHVDLRASGVPRAALVTGWMRTVDDGRRLHFLLGGRPDFPPAAGGGAEAGPMALLFPPGAAGTALSTPDAEKMLASFSCWVPCVARPDALWAPAGGRSEPVTVRRGSFDGHVAHVRGPFAWLVLAEPLAAGDLEPELRALAGEILPLSRGEVGESKRVELERKQARHRELSRAQTGGGWRIQVLVGSDNPAGATTAAAMLCAAAELDGLPYTMAPAGPWSSTMDSSVGIAAGTELLVALTRPPERELPGLRLVEPHTFDVTPEHTDGDDGLRLGPVLDEGGLATQDLRLSDRALNRHTFVCGATGSGKSQTVRHLLTEAARAGLPWLVIEPAKAEYALMAKRLTEVGQDVVVIRPGHPDSAPAGLNPLRPADGFPLQPHADLLRALFLAAFEAQEPFPQILAAALTRCYEEQGWDLTLGESVHSGATPRWPTLADLQRVATAVVGEIGYGKEIADNVQGFIKVRLGSLRLGTAGRFFEGGHPLDFGQLLRRNVVLEIEHVGDDADKAFFMGAVLLRLSQQLWVSAHGNPAPPLRHLTVIEEAHRLLRRPEPGAGGAAGHAVEMFAALLAEVRAYGEGLIIAEQIPGKLTPDVIKNTAVKIVHRLPAKDDRDTVGATMNIDNAQSRYLVTLPPGEAAVFADGMDRPVLVRVPDGSTVEGRSAGVAAPVGPLIGRRSPTCGADCRAVACTLREMRAAAHLRTTEPWLTVWAELAVLAHVAGRPTPTPTAAVLAAFTAAGHPARLVDCALSHAVDDAVAVRSASLQADTGADALAGHVRDALAGLLRGLPSPCPADALAYLATPFRWALVRRELRSAPGPDRHPRTAEWEHRFHRAVPGRTAEEQLAVVESRLLRDLDDTEAVDAVSHGTRRPSAIETAADTTGLPALLESFDDADWALAHFPSLTETA
ncbi:MAG TPA: ATP-binding protein [Pseudonocardiaceae bacterium]